MRLDPAYLSSEIAEYRRTQEMRTRDFGVAEVGLDHHAVCLIGPPGPVTFQGGNSRHWPISIRVVRNPLQAPVRTASEHWEGSKAEPHCIVLDFVWAESDAHGKRLAGALYARMIADDPDARMLNGTWIDRMDWHAVWRGLLDEAVRDLREGGETVRYISEEMRRARIKSAEVARRSAGRRR